LPGGIYFTSIVDGPYDFHINKDFDNDDTDESHRFFTNGELIEQVRIEQNDEAATKFDGAVVANGIDFAEAFKVHDPTIEPGDLVINSGSNWEFVARSSQPYQGGVIGVVSTKPAFVAGMSFDAEDTIDPYLTQRRDQARRDKNYILEAASSGVAFFDFDNDGLPDVYLLNGSTFDALRGKAGDDLKLIWGIGPMLEQALNTLGIWHFDQIAGWNVQNIKWIDQNLEDFRGRVERDRWIEQARKLATGWRPDKNAGDKPKG
jgi:hypothetical protein